MSKTDPALDAALGIDPNDPLHVLARDLVDTTADFAAECAHIRRRNGLSTDAVAKRIGVHPHAVKAFENNVGDFSLGFVRRYCHAIRVRITIDIEEEQL